MRAVLGVDGRRGGWALAVVRLDRNGRASRVRWDEVAGQDADGFRAVLDRAAEAGATAVGVDCPLGLPSTAWRPVDLAAKRALGRASARVFLAPPRVVLAAPTYADARAVARQVLAGKGISAQTYGIRRIVLAVDEALLARPAHPLAGGVVEVHPELSFMALAGRADGDPLASKRTEAGVRARRDTLARWLAPAARSSLDDVPRGDDHLDALAAAWSASRWLAGTARVLGGDTDAEGLPMRIVV